MWLSKTPLRASFLGGGTDYPSYFRDHPGAVLGGTIDKFVYTQALPLAAFSDQKYRVTYRTTESVERIEDIQHPVIRESLQMLNWQGRLNIATMSDLPGGTGLGSSSAFTVGLLNLLHCIQGKTLTRYELARLAIYMEQTVLRENVGVQDQVHAAFGGLSRYEFSGNEFSIQPLRLSTGRLSALNSSMTLVYTGAERSASQVLNTQEARTKQGSNDDYLREMYEMTAVGAQILEDDGDHVAAMIQFANLLDHGWNLKRQLGAVSSQRIDEVYRKGKDLGAWGGKLLGAGGGGFVLFLGPPELPEALETHFGADALTPVRFVDEGSKVSRL
jgi:D-glycero-alpha-D-manno-heptose-7-phosphate kinase